MNPADPTSSARLEASGLTLGYADTDVVRDLDLQVPHGKVTVVVGANACGKSTLLRGLARLLRPRSGAVLLDGEAIHRLPTKQVARTLGLLPQNPITPEGVTVADLVGRGRHPHHGPFGRWTAEDEQAVAEALVLTDTLELADRMVDELSAAASASASGSRWRSPRAPTCCCSTSRPPTSTWPTRSRCSTCSPSSTPVAAPRS